MSSDESLRALYRDIIAAPDATGAHPDDALWERIICDEATADERQHVNEHVLECTACAGVYRSLLSVRREAAAFDPGVAPAARSHRSWAPYALAAAVLAAAVLTPFVWRAWRPSPVGPIDGGIGSASAPAPSVRPALALHPAFRLEKAPVMLSASLAFTPRGAADDRQRLLDALGEALTPYRADDFPEAARRLERLSRDYPDAVEPIFYAGVALLLSGRATESVALLERARAIAPPEFALEIDWRLGLGYVHADLPIQATAPLQRVCAETGAYRARACEALRVVREGK